MLPHLTDNLAADAFGASLDHGTQKLSAYPNQFIFPIRRFLLLLSHRWQMVLIAGVAVAATLIATPAGATTTSIPAGATTTSGPGQEQAPGDQASYAWVAPGSASVAAARAVAPSVAAALAVTWGACGVTTSNTKIIRTFSRASVTSSNGRFFAGGSTNLTCGSSVYGYRHILANHRTEWEQMAVLAQENWRQTADNSIAGALSDPDVVRYRTDKDTFGFQVVMKLVNEGTGQVVGTRTVCAPVARVSKNIITAFPGPCPAPQG
jgi:hypothetical protein